MNHHCLTSKRKRDRSDLKNIFSVFLSVADKDRLKYGKSRRPSDLFNMNNVCLSVDPDSSSLEAKELIPGQHWFPSAAGNPISLDLITRSF